MVIITEGRGEKSPRIRTWGMLVQIIFPQFSRNVSQNSPKNVISSEKLICFCGGALPPPRPVLVNPTPRPNQAFWIHLCVLRILVRFTPRDILYV